MQNLGGCSCIKLHAVSKPNWLSVVVINWFRGHKNAISLFANRYVGAIQKYSKLHSCRY